MKKHTIKLLTVAFTLAAILTLTGCPGPVTPDNPYTPEEMKRGWDYGWRLRLDEV